MAEPLAPASHAVVVAYGPPGLLEDCLVSLDGALPVTVVDNGSSHAARTIAERHGARYLDPGRNLGFAAGVNLAVAEVVALTPAHHHRPPDVLLVNPDATVTPEAVAHLQRVLDSDPGLAAVAPAQRPPDSVEKDPVCWPFPSPSGMWWQAAGLGRLARGRCEFLIGAILLIRGAALVEIGGFDERFFLYSEEIDWQRRATRAGWHVRYCADVVALHAGAGTDADGSRRELRFHVGNERYIRKWFGPWGWRSYRLAHIAGALVRLPVLRGEGRNRALARLKIYLAGPDRLARRLGIVPDPLPVIPRFTTGSGIIGVGSGDPAGSPGSRSCEQARSPDSRTVLVAHARPRSRVGRPLLVDAGALGRNTKGVARVLQEVVPRLVASDPGRYLVACSTPHAAALLPDVPGDRLVVAPYRSQAVWEQWTLPVLGARLGVGAIYSHQECGALWGTPLLLHLPEDPEVRWGREAVTTVRERARRRYSRMAMDRSLARADVVASTGATADDLCRNHGVDPASVTVVPLGVDLARFHPAPSPCGATPGVPYIFHLASADPRDNTDIVVSAFAAATASKDGAMLVVAGELGPQRSRLAVLADRLGVADQVTFPGRVPDGELASLYGHALASVHASSDEGFGLQPLEAMACGALLIAIPAPATVEVVGDAEVLWSEPSTADLARAMDVAWAEPSRRERARQVNPVRAGEYTWDRTAERLHRMLVQLAG